MEQIALIIGNTCLYWSSMVRALAAAAAVFCFWALYGHRSGKILAAAFCVPVAVVLSLVLSRIAHWYFRPELYESLSAALHPGRSGGFALMGAFAGCFLAALITRWMGLTHNFPELLDCLCISGCLGIGVGRLASCFNTAGRGMILPSAQWGILASSIVNPISGKAEPRLAVFLLQSGAAAILFLALLGWYLAGRRRHRDGDAALLFLLCYGASQALLDSLRYDALRLRSNGFISAVQILGVAGMLLAAVVFGIVLVSTAGWKLRYLLLWFVQAGCLGLAGYMEYYVQRHGDAAAMAYSVMGMALAGLVGLILCTRTMAERNRKGMSDGSGTEKANQSPE